MMVGEEPWVPEIIPCLNESLCMIILYHYKKMIK